MNLDILVIILNINLFRETTYALPGTMATLCYPIGIWINRPVWAVSVELFYDVNSQGKPGIVNTDGDQIFIWKH